MSLLIHPIDGKGGRDGRDGRDGKCCVCHNIITYINEEKTMIYQTGKGLSGEKGEPGQRGEPGPSFYTNTHSFVGENGIAGITYNNGSDILSIIHRDKSVISYIGVIWSMPDEATTFNIEIKDLTNNIQTLVLGPSPKANSKNVYEISLSPHITTPFTRLLKMSISCNHIVYKPTIYSIIIGYN
jgi:hypothetical protein